MGAVLLGFGSAILGAILGAYLQKLWTPDPSPEIAALRRQVAQFQTRIETLESERKHGDTIARFAPRSQVTGQPPDPQHLVLTADREFEMRRLDYIADTGATITYEDIEDHGNEIRIPINNTKIMQIWNLLPRHGFLPISMKFRCHLRIDNIEKEVTTEALIKPEFKFVNNTHTFLLTVTAGL
jgi:hypothetical protein